MHLFHAAYIILLLSASVSAAEPRLPNSAPSKVIKVRSSPQLLPTARPWSLAEVVEALRCVLPVAVAPSRVWLCGLARGRQLGDRLRLIARRFIAFAEAEESHASSL